MHQIQKWTKDLKINDAWNKHKSSWLGIGNGSLDMTAKHQAATGKTGDLDIKLKFCASKETQEMKIPPTEWGKNCKLFTW